MAEKPAEESSSLDGARRRAGTATSSFGVSKREGHDASLYYNSRLNEGLVASREVGDGQMCPEEHLNSLICGDSRALPLPDNCVHLVVTSLAGHAARAIRRC